MSCPKQQPRSRRVCEGEDLRRESMVLNWGDWEIERSKKLNCPMQG
jgi:hypothetical protein